MESILELVSFFFKRILDWLFGANHMSFYKKIPTSLFQKKTLEMSSFIKADVRQTNEYGASFSHFLFDTLSKLADRSSEQV